jgi:hypothetical protein
MSTGANMIGEHNQFQNYNGQQLNMGMQQNQMSGMQSNMGQGMLGQTNMDSDMNLLDPMGNDKRTYRKKKTWCMNLKI